MRRRPVCGVRSDNLRERRRRRPLEQFDRLDHHPVLTEAAQRDLLIDPCLLNRMQGLLRGGPQPLLPRPIALNEVVEGMLGLLQSAIGGTIQAVGEIEGNSTPR